MRKNLYVAVFSLFFLLINVTQGFAQKDTTKVKPSKIPKDSLDITIPEIESMSFEPGASSFTNRINTPAPNPASMTKMLDYPVSLYTGLPTIEIPIYELRCHGVTVPIKLSYHAAGFKPEECPSWVGLNWALQAGGCITRKVNGFSDEESVPGDLNGYNSSLIYDDGGYVDHAEFDEFYFNIPGYSGKFYFEGYPFNSEGLVTGPSAGIRVKSFGTVQEPVYQNNCDNRYSGYEGCLSDLEAAVYGYSYDDPCADYTEQIAGFKLTLPDGTACYFGRDSENSVAAPVVDKSISGPFWGCTALTYDTWHLLKMIAPDGKSAITFSYTAENLNEFQQQSSKQFSARRFSGMGDPPIDEYTPCTEVPVIQAGYNPSIKYSFSRYLTRISSDNAQIDFTKSVSTQLKNEYATSLSCISSFPGSLYQSNQKLYQLDYITIKDNLLNTCWDYHFHYTSSPKERLKLLSIDENSLEKYGFDYYPFIYGNQYNPEVLYNSGYTDYYGFYCRGLIDFYHDQGSISPTDYWEQTANRFTNISDPSEEASLVQKLNTFDSYANLHATPNDITLEKINYQTGGYTKFIYEGNYYGSYLEVNYSTGKVEVKTGSGIAPGLRIAQITNYDATDQMKLLKDYSYEQAILKNKPSLWWKDTVDNTPSEVIASFTNAPRLLYNDGSGSPVVYPKVVVKETEYGAANGHTEHYFRSFQDNPGVLGRILHTSRTGPAKIPAPG
ncbi:MAG: hypothetical protein JXR41_10460 [Bacteroidales bacterium]|nr:hypothetical protein [Bacteroidales bacterium]